MGVISKPKVIVISKSLKSLHDIQGPSSGGPQTKEGVPRLGLGSPTELGVPRLERGVPVWGKTCEAWIQYHS